MRGEASGTACDKEGADSVVLGFGSDYDGTYVSKTVPCAEGSTVVTELRAKELLNPTLHYTAELRSAAASLKQPLTVIADILPPVPEGFSGKEASLVIDFFVDQSHDDAGYQGGGLYVPDAGVDAGTAGTADAGVEDAGAGCGLPMQPCCDGACVPGVACVAATNTCG